MNASTVANPKNAPERNPRIKIFFTVSIDLYAPIWVRSETICVGFILSIIFYLEITASNVALVFKDGKVIYHNIENSMDPNGKPIYNNTVFPIWSMSKPITIVAMMQLYEDGLIDFEDKLSKYIPEFENLKCKGENDIYECKNDLTLFHLMTHRSGYSYYDNPLFFTSNCKI